jgi:hypothetical protein
MILGPLEPNWQISGIVQFIEPIVNHLIRIVWFDRD